MTSIRMLPAGIPAIDVGTIFSEASCIRSRAFACDSAGQYEYLQQLAMKRCIGKSGDSPGKGTKELAVLFQRPPFRNTKKGHQGPVIGDAAGAGGGAWPGSHRSGALSGPGIWNIAARTATALQPHCKLASTAHCKHRTRPAALVRHPGFRLAASGNEPRNLARAWKQRPAESQSPCALTRRRPMVGNI